MRAIDDLLDQVQAILLDFDGPICDVFAGRPASNVAETMRSFLQSAGVGRLEATAQGPDPLRVLRWTDDNRPDLTVQIESVLVAEEVAAVATAEPTPFAHETIKAAYAAGIPVAIVSNNSADAIDAYLAAHGLDEFVTSVVGRAYGMPNEMKPNPIGLRRAIAQLNVQPQACIFIGDSPTDMEASVRAGTRALGYAKSGDRKPALDSAGADAIVDEMCTIATLLGAR